MAYSDATRIDNNTQRMTGVGFVRPDFRRAAKAFGESVEDLFDVYGLSKPERQAFRDRLIDLCRYADTVMDVDWSTSSSSSSSSHSNSSSSSSSSSGSSDSSASSSSSSA